MCKTGRVLEHTEAPALGQAHYDVRQIGVIDYSPPSLLSLHAEPESLGESLVDIMFSTKL